jgi:uncharacterized phage protein (TIGR02218 family)
MTVNLERRTQCIRFEAKDGTILRFVLRYPMALTMSNSEVYESGDIATKTDVSATVEGGATVIDIGSVYSVDAITREQIDSAKWDDAFVYSFFTDWANPVEDEEEDRVYIMGKVREEDDRYTVELLSLIDLLNKTTGRLITPGCQWTFADSHVNGELIATDKSRCKIDSAAHDHAGTVTSVTNNMQFRASAFNGVYVDDWFGNGEIMFTTGLNAGLAYSFIKIYQTNGTFTLNLKIVLINIQMENALVPSRMFRKNPPLQNLAINNE